jgi:FG-GAP-like repeat/FG-GAP repeat
MQSSATQYMSMYVTGQRFGVDPAGSMQPPVLVMAGQAAYHDNGHGGTGTLGSVTNPYRAGDYSGVAFDPNNINSLWAANEFALNAGFAGWGTRVVGFSVSPWIQPGQKIFAVGEGTGRPTVKVYDAASGVILHQFDAYDPNFSGGVRVVVADVNGDGTQDVITGAGPGGGPHVRVFDGTTGQEMFGFFAYDPNFPGGVNVAAGDVDHDGKADIITGAGSGGGPHVKVWSGADQHLIYSFMAYNPSFTGGVTVAAGDVDNDGYADIVTGAGATGGPDVKVYNGKVFALMFDFFAFEPTFTGGVFVAAGDTNGDGRADVVVGRGAGAAPEVRVFSGVNMGLIADFNAYNASFTGGVRVAVRDVDGDGKADIITGAGSNGGPHVRVFKSPNYASSLYEFFAFDASFQGGIFVG